MHKRRRNEKQQKFIYKGLLEKNLQSGEAFYRIPINPAWVSVRWQLRKAMKWTTIASYIHSSCSQADATGGIILVAAVTSKPMTISDGFAGCPQQTLNYN